MCDLNGFRNTFKGLTGNDPFPWQEAMYERILGGDIPASCNLPTGLGKTAVIPIWLIALANDPKKVPRRLVYIVNRRTVVDQATREAEKIRENLSKSELATFAQRLRDLCGLAPNGSDDPPLAISTLRGQFADNGEWCADPARPAVVVGTIDMIGSRLLFSGYGCGRGRKPHHAGLLGQDSLIVHDEAHLEPAFQELLVAVEKEQSIGREGRAKDFRPLRVMELTATSRSQREPFGLTDEECNLPSALPHRPRKPVHYVWQRLRAKKGICLHKNADPKRLADEIADLALRFKDTKRAVLVFVRKVDDVEKVVDKLRKAKQKVQQLAGTLRGLERDKLAKEDSVFLRFLPKAEQENETVFLVCTSAGEVGVDITADHLVCDLSTFESMAQRFGRVNRFGERDDTEIHVVYPNEFDDKNESDQRRKKTLDLLRALAGDGSPIALGGLDSEARLAAFAPTPAMLPTTDILFDSWCLTTIREKLPGRPPVEPYLHGISEWEAPETHVAWREEVGLIAGELLDKSKPQDLLEDYPLKPHELLRDISSRVFERLKKLNAAEETPVWVVSGDDSVDVTSLGELIGLGKDAINYKTILLPPKAGGLDNGMLTAGSAAADDVADEWLDEKGQQRRARVWDGDPVPDAMRLIRTIDTMPDADDDEGEATASRRYWRWYEATQVADGDGSTNAQKPVLWKVHTDDVIDRVRRFVRQLHLPKEIQEALILAARLHDLGKRRPRFQRVLGNVNPDILLAKSGKRQRALRLDEDCRHEFGSLLDIEKDEEFCRQKEEVKELVRHFIAAHHGRARPHFPGDEAFDPDSVRLSHEASREVPRRFAKLQRKYGRWGLAYLESLLRAADWAASAAPSEFVEEKQEDQA
jgi:CRISPR-associated endonuclease/helicase Cas3